MTPTLGRSPSVRPKRVIATAIGVGALAFAASGQAHALPMAQGDNGDVKIHRTSTASTDQSNDPKVCEFNLAAFNFDQLQQVTYTITEQPPTGTDQVSGGTISLAAGTGHGTTLSLPDGHYRLTWTFEGENGSGKHKVFQVDCSQTGPATGGSTDGNTGGTTGGRLMGSVNAGGGGGAPQYSAGRIAAGSAVVAAALGGFGIYVARRRRAAGDGES
jgi:hypothetical protein